MLTFFFPFGASTVSGFWCVSPFHFPLTLFSLLLYNSKNCIIVSDFDLVTSFWTKARRFVFCGTIPSFLPPPCLLSSHFCAFPTRLMFPRWPPAPSFPGKKVRRSGPEGPERIEENVNGSFRSPLIFSHSSLFPPTFFPSSAGKTDTASYKKSFPPEIMFPRS